MPDVTAAPPPAAAAPTTSFVAGLESEVKELAEKYGGDLKTPEGREAFEAWAAGKLSDLQSVAGRFNPKAAVAVGIAVHALTALHDFEQNTGL